jgi:surfeit locus 1 family protein
MMPARNYRFARRPKWVLGHAIALVAVIVFVMMGFWQLRRLGERQDFNTLLLDRTTVDALAYDEALARYGPDQEDLELRLVVVDGEYRRSEEIILLARSFNGVSGHHVLTPLYIEEDRAVLVDRGWVPIDFDQPGLDEFAPPEGPVALTGVLRKSETRGSFGPVIPATGVVSQVPRVDLARLGQQIAGVLDPVFVQLVTQNPAPGGTYPALVALPEPSEGPHRGYAVQWFLFAAVTAIGYPILLRRTAEGSQLAAG